jgi:V-type H+-transporting ATPase subunit a
MSQFRSEKMELLQVFMARDAAHDTLRELGELGCLQFKDLNHDKSSFNRPHVLEVRKCDDILRIMRYLTEVCSNEKLAKKKHASTAPAPPHALDDLHERLHEIEKEVKVRLF